MSICVACPSCREKLILLDGIAGTVVQCPNCRAQMRVPAAAVPEAVPLRRSRQHDESEQDDSADLAAGSGVNAGRGPVVALLAALLVVPVMCCGIIGLGGPSKPASVPQSVAPPPAPPAAVQVAATPVRDDAERGDFTEHESGNAAASHASGTTHLGGSSSGGHSHHSTGTGPKTVHVKGYTTKSGKHVAPHTRSAPTRR
jgi:hypothetical protein